MTNPTSDRRNRFAAGIGLLAIVATPAIAFDLELDPGVGWVVRGGVGEGRSVYFSANETFMLEGAGFRADMVAGTYEVVIFQGHGELEPAGAILHSVQVPLGGVGMAWQDAPITFEFIEGQDYILHFRYSMPGNPVASQYERGADWWGNDPSEFRDLGVVTIRNGRSSYNSQSATNLAFPRMRLLGISVGEPCYANCDGSTTEPILTVDDFTCFINEFAQAQSLPVSQQIEHYANCDGSTTEPILTVDDFTCFINAFAQGCP